MKITICIMLILFSALASSLELASGVLFDYGKTSRTAEEKTASGIIYQVMSMQSVNDDHSILAASNLGTGSTWFSLFDEVSLHSVNIESKAYLGNWPLTPWPQSTRMIGEGTNWKSRPLIAGALGGDTTAVSNPRLMTLDQIENYDLPAFKEFIGCLSNAPLRYGDIDTNGTSELVLILDQDLVVFSPAQEKIIFAARFANADELQTHEVDAWFDGGLEANITTQYVARSGVGNRLNAAFAATRSFAKIYLDDFNNDGKRDIIVWRKLYESRLKTDAVNGFTLEGELFVHYQLQDGEYQLQTNAPAVDGQYAWDQSQQGTVQGWLTSKSQTWQSGFPSKSECAGQEGQLIPEMHAPLLNDPDVLK